MCIGGHYTMDRHDAVDAAALVGAKTVIPCHYNTFPPIETDAHAFKADVESATARTVVVLDPGQTHCRCDARDRPHSGRAFGARDARRRARRHRRASREVVLGDRRVGLRRDPAPARVTSSSPRSSRARSASCTGSRGRRRWSPSRPTRSTTWRRCSRSGSRTRLTGFRPLPAAMCRQRPPLRRPGPPVRAARRCTASAMAR